MLHVKFIDLCMLHINLSSCACELRRWYEQKHHFPNYPGWPTVRQTDEEHLHLKALSKTVIVSVFVCSLILYIYQYLALMGFAYEYAYQDHE